MSTPLILALADAVRARRTTR